jgi:predicted Rossmann-fold nucleotide-binding protein
MIKKIISGGQTGADRVALDWAIKNGVPHGGWCPKGRRAEDGSIPDHYLLQETPQRKYRQRTRWNVRDSDATVIVTLTENLTGGSLFTCEYAKTIHKPCLHVFSGDGWPERLKTFLEANAVKRLNVAGPRSSSAPGIEKFVREVLNEMRRFL